MTIFPRVRPLQEAASLDHGRPRSSRPIASMRARSAKIEPEVDRAAGRAPARAGAISSRTGTIARPGGRLRARAASRPDDRRRRDKSTLPASTPKRARDLRSRRASRGRASPPAPFLRHNREVVASSRALAERAPAPRHDGRREGHLRILHKVVPADACSAAAFERGARRSNARPPRLFLRREDIFLGDAAGGHARSNSPTRSMIGGFRLPLSYRFEPGHAEDGITVTVPLAALASSFAAPFDWLVPGFSWRRRRRSSSRSPRRSARTSFRCARRRSASPRAKAKRAGESLSAALRRFLEKENRRASPRRRSASPPVPSTCACSFAWSTSKASPSRRHRAISPSCSRSSAFAPARASV